MARVAVIGELKLIDVDDRARQFYREHSNDALDRVRCVIEKLDTWKWWASPDEEIDCVLAGTRSLSRIGRVPCAAASRHSCRKLHLFPAPRILASVSP